MQIQDTEVKVRIVNISDYSSILRLSKIVIKEAYPEDPFNEDKIKEVFFKALNHEDFMGIVLEVKGVIRGFVFLTFSEIFYVKKTFCLCLAIYVEKGFRKYGHSLFTAIDLVARNKGVKDISIHTMAGLSPKGMGKLLYRLGFKEREIGYWKEVEYG